MIKIQKGVFLSVCVLLLFPATSIEVLSAESSDPVVLITGFEPFDIYDINPSQVLAETLDGMRIKDTQITGIVLPVDFNESVAMVTQAIDDFQPIAVISLGLSARSRRLCIEKLGVNLKRDPEADEAGSQKIDPSGPLVRLTSLPERDIIQGIRKAGIPIRISFCAGTYVCNTVLYSVQSYIEENELDIQAGFIHVPLLSNQDPKSLEFDHMLEAIEIAIRQSV